VIEAAALTLILWFGLLSMRAAEVERWWLTGFELALMALAAVVIVRRRLAVRFHPIAIVLGAVAAWGAAQAGLGISVDPQRTLQLTLGWAVNCASFSLTLAICMRERVRERFLTAQGLFALALGISAIIGLYAIGELGPFAYKNQLAAYLEIGTAIAMARAIVDQKHVIAWVIAAGAMFACAAAAGSRAGAILCLAELLVLPLVGAWFGYISVGALGRIGALGIVSAGALVMITGWETVWQRLQEPNPYALRADMLRSSVEMVRDRPLTGFGLGAWPSAYPGYALYDDGTFVNEAHNDWAQWAAEGGLPLLLAMLAVVAMLARPAVQSLWGLGLMAVFVHAWVDYPFEQRPALAAFFFSIAGALMAAGSAASRVAAGATASKAAYRPDELSQK
jgi:O-Antigen ligase